MEELKKQLKSLKIATTFLAALVLILIAINAIQFLHAGTFKELTAQRINIVENDGTLRMAISNRQLQDPGSYDGKKIAKRDRPAGMIFFNDDGDECGGLVYDGGKNGASMTYSIDQYKNDQIMQIQYAQEKSGDSLARSYGLKLWDRNDRYPTGRLMAYVDSLKALHDSTAYQSGIQKLRASGAFGGERLFVGKNTAGEIGLFLRDSTGTPRLKIFIDKNNQPVIETLDANGAVITNGGSTR